MTRRTRQGSCAGPRGLLLVFLLVFVYGCGANDNVLRSGRETAENGRRESEKQTFSSELGEFKTADFKFVYILRRRDAGAMDAEDRSVIKMNTMDANRRVSADDGRAFIIGSNFEIPPDDLKAIYDRFAVEDHSPPPALPANTNANN